MAARGKQNTIRIGVDTGGTFTDFVRLSDGEIIVRKQLSTPDDPASSIDFGARILVGGAPFEVVHGSTIATNAVLERKGARVALIVTDGFQDVLAIGRQTRPQLYNLFVAPRRQLVETDLVFGLAERLDASGQTLVPVDPREVDQLARLLTERG